MKMSKFYKATIVTMIFLMFQFITIREKGFKPGGEED